jgi:predicted house-cleaning noncanonical NTP pyrophosphatase (MazG superfamily)
MKLVRDRIPEVIHSHGEIACIRIADESEYPSLLNSKLREEVQEYLESGSAEELADILEVVFALGACIGMTEETLEQLRRTKADARGRFLKRIVWYGSRQIAGSPSSAEEVEQQGAAVALAPQLPRVAVDRLNWAAWSPSLTQGIPLFDSSAFTQPPPRGARSRARRSRREPRPTTWDGTEAHIPQQLKLLEDCTAEAWFVCFGQSPTP